MDMTPGFPCGASTVSGLNWNHLDGRMWDPRGSQPFAFIVVVFVPSLQPYSWNVMSLEGLVPNNFLKQTAVVQCVCFVKQLLSGVFFHSQPSQIITNSVANGLNKAIREGALSDELHSCMV